MKGSTLIRVLREIEKQTNENRVRHIGKKWEDEKSNQSFVTFSTCL